jgi:hypothetical protein
MSRSYKVSCYVDCANSEFKLDSRAESALNRSIESFLSEYAEDMAAYCGDAGDDIDVDLVNSYIKDTWCEGQTHDGMLEKINAIMPGIHIEVHIDSDWAEEDDDWWAGGFDIGIIDIETVAAIYASISVFAAGQIAISHGSNIISTVCFDF